MEQAAPATPRPHDLLWLADAGALMPLAPQPLPSWASADWIMQAPVVVRRQKLDNAALLPVGLRGRERNQRLAACVPLAAVVRCIRPEMLAQLSIALHGIAALETLTASRPLLDDLGLAWGPTGGTGFMLATGLPVLHAQSDLDLVLRAPSPLDRGQTSLLSKLLREAACRIDLQIDTGFGGFSFAEWQAGRGRVLLKTDTGPVLTRDPWQAEMQAA
ncbi:MAG TPA: malonate decarboxylase holo-ACP synthase [Oxalicibacterium sp.]|nr:malonate decarboxylase holo-ACP synthase [Oxalicibacterium sp.]